MCVRVPLSYYCVSLHCNSTYMAMTNSGHLQFTSFLTRSNNNLPYVSPLSFHENRHYHIFNCVCNYFEGTCFKVELVAHN